MSAELLRRAAALMRERAEAATDSTWSTLGERADGGAYIDSEAAPLWVGHVSAYRDAEHIASWHPDVALAVADWLGRAAEHHRSESVDDLYLWDCDECPEGDCAGHTRDCCWGCVAQVEDGYAGRVVYPCGEMTAALAVARAFLGRDACPTPRPS